MTAYFIHNCPWWAISPSWVPREDSTVMHLPNTDECDSRAVVFVCSFTRCLHTSFLFEEDLNESTHPTKQESYKLDGVKTYIMYCNETAKVVLWNQK